MPGTHTQALQQRLEKRVLGTGRTPPLGLGHLKDNLEGSGSTAKVQTEPTLTGRGKGSATGWQDSPTAAERGCPKGNSHRR